jgi:hypothetical protein
MRTTLILAPLAVLLLLPLAAALPNLAETVGPCTVTSYFGVDAGSHSLDCAAAGIDLVDYSSSYWLNHQSCSLHVVGVASPVCP